MTRERATNPKALRALGEVIRATRSEQGYTQERFAAHVGIDRGFEIFGEGVSLPSAGEDEGFAPDDAARTVEVEKAACRAARRLFDEKMNVDPEGYRPRERAVAFVEVLPSALHYSEVAVSPEIRDRRREKIRVRDEVRVEDRDEFLRSALERVLQSPRLEAVAPLAAQGFDLESPRSGVGRDAVYLGGRIVVGVVDDHDARPLHPVARGHANAGFHQPRYDVAFVINR